MATIAEKLKLIADNEQLVFNAGKQEENDAFWNVVQQGGRRTAYDVAFCWWDCEYLHPKYKVVPTSGANAARNIIYRCAKLKKIAVIRIAEETQVNYMLYYCPELEYVRIDGTIGQSGIDLKYSTKLSKESIESIVNHLSDSATGKTLTLSKTAVDEAFRYISGMYNEQGVWEEIINIKGSECWMWEELIAPKVEGGKWIINLV